VNLRDDLSLPGLRLRRYARALVGSHPGPNDAADDLVRAVLQCTQEADAPRPPQDVTTHLFSLLIEMHRELLREQSARAPISGSRLSIDSGSLRAEELHSVDKMPDFYSPRDKLSAALEGLKLEEREAFLLIALEAFTYAQAARILKISRSLLIARLSRARESIGAPLQESPSARKVKPRPTHLRLVK
jgi:RNA polymerase sigma-70 factor (ECF subfamily)